MKASSTRERDRGLGPKKSCSSLLSSAIKISRVGEPGAVLRLRLILSPWASCRASCKAFCTVFLNTNGNFPTSHCSAVSNKRANLETKNQGWSRTHPQAFCILRRPQLLGAVDPLSLFQSRDRSSFKMSEAAGGSYPPSRSLLVPSANKDFSKSGSLSF